MIPYPEVMGKYYFGELNHNNIGLPVFSLVQLMHEDQETLDFNKALDTFKFDLYIGQHVM